MIFRKKKKIQELERQIADLEIQLDERGQDIDKLKKRLLRAGNAPYDYVSDKSIKTYTAEIKVETWGMYIVLGGETAVDHVLEAAKEQVVSDIAKGLIENNLVQFVVRDMENDFDPLNQACTVAAKINVVPWEQLTTKKLVIRKMVAE